MVDWQNVDGNVPLHEASWNGNMDLVMLLIEHKANLNIRNKQRNTPLIFAAYGNNMAVVHALVEAGADTTILGFQNRTAAEWAKTWRHHAIVQYLNHDIRFLSSARSDGTQLCCVKGRSLRAIQRDLKENSIFVSHMLHRLNHFCTGER